MGSLVKEQKDLFGNLIVLLLRMDKAECSYKF
ncbi:hypothetical protein NIES25_40880 [Nostoc linckia NIES-25]|nr:hypothetical protein NIES25_40880 [Nostoc linckia NIES-25]